MFLLLFAYWLLICIPAGVLMAKEDGNKFGAIDVFFCSLIAFMTPFAAIAHIVGCITGPFLPHIDRESHDRADSMIATPCRCNHSNCRCNAGENISRSPDQL